MVADVCLAHRASCARARHAVSEWVPGGAYDGAYDGVLRSTLSWECRMTGTPVSVLAVDDEPFTLKALKRILRRYDVTVASSGREALDIIAQGQRFDVILCDVMMPELTGVDVYEHLRAHSPGTEARIVFITGGAFGAEIVDFLREVPNTTLAKPFDPQQIIDAVDAVAAAQRA